MKTRISKLNLPVVTLRDIQRFDAENEYKAEKKALQAKVKHWEKQVEKFGGDVQKATLEKFKSQLAEF